MFTWELQIWLIFEFAEIPGNSHKVNPTQHSLQDIAISNQSKPCSTSQKPGCIWFDYSEFHTRQSLINIWPTLARLVRLVGLLVVLSHSQRYFNYVCWQPHRCAGSLKVYLWSGFQRHRHFLGFFEVPVQHWNWAILSVLTQLDPSMEHWDSNSLPKDLQLIAPNQWHIIDRVVALLKIPPLPLQNHFQTTSFKNWTVMVIQSFN